MDTPKNYVISKLNTKFTCPICEVEFKDKIMLVDHIKFNHSDKVKNIDVDKLIELEHFKQGKSDILNI